MQLKLRGYNVLAVIMILLLMLRYVIILCHNIIILYTYPQNLISKKVDIISNVDLIR